jgi:hypothetical protein
LEDINLCLHATSAVLEVEIFVAAPSRTAGTSVMDESPDPRSGFDDEACSLLLMGLRGTFSLLSKSRARVDVKAEFKTGS